MSIVAVNLKTESGDDYLSLFTDIKDTDDFVERVFEEMQEELAFVYEFSVVTDDESKKVLSKALWEKINSMEQE